MSTSIYSGYAAGVGGFATGVFLIATYQVMDVLNFPSGLYFIMALIMLVEFFMGIIEAYFEGIGYSMGLFFAEVIMNDFGSLITGALSLLGHIAGILIKAGLLN